MRLKIHAGTANHGDPPLCQTCRFATIIKGPRLRDEILQCSRLSDHAPIRFCLTACTGYADRRQASIREMEEIACVPEGTGLGQMSAVSIDAHSRRLLRRFHP
jgi:hypothetical protein